MIMLAINTLKVKFSLNNEITYEPLKHDGLQGPAPGLNNSQKVFQCQLNSGLNQIKDYSVAVR